MSEYAVNQEKYAALARQAAAEGCVLFLYKQVRKSQFLDGRPLTIIKADLAPVDL